MLSTLAELHDLVRITIIDQLRSIGVLLSSFSPGVGSAAPALKEAIDVLKDMPGGATTIKSA